MKGFFLSIVLLLFFYEIDAQVVFQPLSSITVDVEVNGQITPQTTATIQFSDQLNKGSFQVGGLNIDLEASAPTFNYRIKEVGRVPLAVLSQVIKVCSVVDTAGFAASQALNQQQNYIDLTGVLQSEWEASIPSATRRRLLQTSSNNMVLGVDFTPVNKELTSIDAQLNVPNGNNLAAWANTLNNAINNDNSEQAQNAQSILALNSDLVKLPQIVSLINGAIKASADTAAAQFNLQYMYLQGNQSIDNNILGADLNDTNVRLAALALNLANVITQLSNQTVTDEQTTLRLESLINGVNNAVYLQVTQSALQRATASAYFQIIANFPSAFQVLVSDPGTPGVPGGILTGADTRILLETFYLMYDYVAIGFQNTIFMGVTQINWYVSSENEIANINPAITLRDLIYGFAANTTCYRPYYDNTKHWVNEFATNNNTLCTMWLELSDVQCQAHTSFVKNTQTIQTSWTNLDVNGNAYYNTPSITSTTAFCTTTPTATTYIVLKTITDVTSYTENNMCTYNVGYPLHSGNYILGTVRNQQLITISQASSALVSSTLCTPDILTQISLGTTIMGRIFYFGYTAYQGIFNDILRLEQKKYGRIPSDLTFESLPFDYVGPIGNSTNTGAYSPRSCTRVTFGMAHRTTVPVYAMYVDPIQVVSKQYSRTITQVNGSAPLDDPQFLDETVFFYDNIILTDDTEFLLPKSSLFVGSVTNPLDLGNGQTPPLYVYDIPDALLDVTNSIYSRKNKPTYYLMPPGTLETWDLVTFNAANNGLYSATDAGVGINLFAIPAVYDNTGSLVCNIPSGLPSSNSLNGATAALARTCLGVNIWNDNTAITTTMGMLCSVTNTKLYNRGVDYQATTDFTAAWLNGNAGFAVTFVYEGMATAYPVTLLSSNGLNIAIRVDFDLQKIVITIQAWGLTQTIFSTSSTLFNLHKHSVHIGFHLPSDLSGDFAYIAIDGWIDRWVAITTCSPTSSVPCMPRARTGSSWLVPGSITGLEAVYGMIEVASGAAFNTILIETVHVCSFAVAENHCELPTAETLVFAAPSNILQNSAVSPYQSTQSAPVILFRSWLLAATLPSSSSVDIFTSSNGFTMTFWMHIGQGWLEYNTGSSLTLFRVKTTGTNAIQVTAYISNNRLAIDVLQHGTTVTLTTTIFSVTLSTPLIPAKVALLYQPTTNMLQMYVNSALEYSITATGMLSATSGTGYSFTIMNAENAVSMIRVYPLVLTNSVMLSDLQQDTDSIADYVSPTGYCRVSNHDISQKLYCRSPALANGNAETYAALTSLSGGTFANIKVNQCDDGWLPPDCLIPCSRPSNITGVCLTDDVNDPAQYGATGTLVPAGTRCDYLRLNKQAVAPLAAGAVDQGLTLTPRQYDMQASVVIPSGMITTIINIVAQCPIVQSVGLGSTAQLLLGNPLSTGNILVQVVWMITDNSTCDLSTYNTGPVQIGQIAEYVTIPACGEVAATIYSYSDLSDRKLCSSLTTDNVAALVSSTGLNQASTILVSQVSVADSVLQEVYAVGSGLASLMFVLLAQTGTDISVYQNLYNEAVLIHDQSVNASHTKYPFQYASINITSSCGPGTLCAQLLANATALTKIVGQGIPTIFPGVTFPNYITQVVNNNTATNQGVNQQAYNVLAAIAFTLVALPWLMWMVEWFIWIYINRTEVFKRFKDFSVTKFLYDLPARIAREAKRIYERWLSSELASKEETKFLINNQKPTAGLSKIVTSKA